MKRIDIIASVDAYNNLRSFASVDELNEAVRQYKSTLTLKKTELAVLNLLHRYSCRYPGVSFLRKSVIGELIGKSRRTIIRVCKRLEELGVIRQYAMKRANDMQQTSNAIVIQAPQQSEIHGETDINDAGASRVETPPVTQESGNTNQKYVTHKTTSTNKTLKQKIKEYKRNVAPVADYDYTFVSSSIPQSFTDAVSPFFRQASDIYKLWRKAKLAAKHSGIGDQLLLHADTLAKAFKEAIYTYKTRRMTCDIFGYVYGTFRNITAQIGRQMHGYNGGLDWLKYEEE